MEPETLSCKQGLICLLQAAVVSQYFGLFCGEGPWGGFSCCPHLCTISLTSEHMRSSVVHEQLWAHMYSGEKTTLAKVKSWNVACLSIDSRSSCEYWQPTVTILTSFAGMPISFLFSLFGVICQQFLSHDFINSKLGELGGLQSIIDLWRMLVVVVSAFNWVMYHSGHGIAWEVFSDNAQLCSYLNSPPTAPPLCENIPLLCFFWLPSWPEQRFENGLIPSLLTCFFISAYQSGNCA